MIAIAGIVNTAIGQVYVSPGGVATATWRIGERRGGVIVSTPDLSDAEIERAGLTGGVRPAPPEANRLHA